MTQILPYIHAFVVIISGGYLSLLGFGIINPKKNDEKHQEKMIKWRKKFGGFSKYGGIALAIWGITILLNPDLNAFTVSEKAQVENWTENQKEMFKNNILNSSKFLQSINSDTADFVAKCFVEKYAERYTLIEARKHDELPQMEQLKLMKPFLVECFELYDLDYEK